MLRNIYFSELALVDETGATIRAANGAGVQGLLLLDDSTVCDIHFHNTTADIVCKLLGYERHSTWTSGLKWNIQSELYWHDFVIECWGDDWSYCDFDHTDYGIYEDCTHDQDIFVTCIGSSRPGENSNLINKY